MQEIAPGVLTPPHLRNRCPLGTVEHAYFQNVSLWLKYLEIRLPVSGCERGLACHPERSEGSGRAASQILRCAQDDKSYLQMSPSDQFA